MAHVIRKSIAAFSAQILVSNAVSSIKRARAPWGKRLILELGQRISQNEPGASETYPESKEELKIQNIHASEDGGQRIQKPMERDHSH